MIKHSAGLVSISFRKYTVAEILNNMQKCALSYVEWGSDVHAPCDDEKKLCEIAHMQNELGISCCSYGTYFRLGITDVDELERYIYAAKILGTDILRLWCGDRNSESYSEPEREKLFENSRRAAEIAKKYDATLCMECHNNTYTETFEGALELVNSVNCKNFGMYWQPNQRLSFEDNLRYASGISEYVRNVHVFNWKQGEKYPLAGAVDTWRKYLGCFDKPKKLLLEFMPDDRIESLLEESRALFEIIG